MKIMSDKQFREEIEKAINESHRREQIELEFCKIDDRINALANRVDELQYALNQAQKRKLDYLKAPLPNPYERKEE